MIDKDRAIKNSGNPHIDELRFVILQHFPSSVSGTLGGKKNPSGVGEGKSYDKIKNAAQHPM
jgi:hypothetical protein